MSKKYLIRNHAFPRHVSVHTVCKLPITNLAVTTNSNGVNLWSALNVILINHLVYFSCPINLRDPLLS